MFDEQEALTQNGEPVLDSENDTREIETHEMDQPLWERWENWATVVDR